MLCSSCLFRLLEPLASGAPSLCASTGKVKNQGQGSLRTAQANVGRSLSSHASSHASWCQCPRGPCTIPCGGCAASRCKPSTCAEHLGCCHSFIVTKEAAANILAHHLRVSLGQILRSSFLFLTPQHALALPERFPAAVVVAVFHHVPEACDAVPCTNPKCPTQPCEGKPLGDDWQIMNSRGLLTVVLQDSGCFLVVKVKGLKPAIVRKGRWKWRKNALASPGPPPSSHGWEWDVAEYSLAGSPF